MEILLLIIIVIIVLICAAVIFYATVYNKFQDYIIRINEVEALIDTNLRNKYDLINRAIPIVKSNIDKDRNVFEEIVKLRSRKIGNFELYRILTRASNELNGLKTEFPDIEKVRKLRRYLNKLLILILKWIIVLIIIMIIFLFIIHYLKNFHQILLLLFVNMKKNYSLIERI